MPNYATLNELKVWLSIGTVDTTDDASLTIALNGAEAAIDRYCSRSFVAAGTVASVRYFQAIDANLVHVTDIGNLTDLVVATDLDFDGQYATVWAATDYQVDPINAIADSRPVTAIRARRGGGETFPVYGEEKLVKVTARWGWPAIPAEVKQAAAPPWVMSAPLRSTSSSASSIASNPCRVSGVCRAFRASSAPGSSSSSWSTLKTRKPRAKK